MDRRDFIIGMFSGCLTAIAAVVAHDKAINAIPVYEQGFQDGLKSFKIPEKTDLSDLESFEKMASMIKQMGC